MNIYRVWRRGSMGTSFRVSLFTIIVCGSLSTLWPTLTTKNNDQSWRFSVLSFPVIILSCARQLGLLRSRCTLLYTHPLIWDCASGGNSCRRFRVSLRVTCCCTIYICKLPKLSWLPIRANILYSRFCGLN